jgi:hypothetical protein
MRNKTTKIKFLTLTAISICFLLLIGSSTKVSAQKRDPFSKPAWTQPKPAPAPSKPSAAQPSDPSNLGAPPIQARIAYYRRMRELAIASGAPIPKVTSVLTLSEMAVNGIFKTPRGFAAMVEATPIKLSYAVYPGEKFFDGQLVAIEENRLVFRKVSKMSNGKFVSAEETKPLRQYTVQEEVQGTAPSDSSKDKPAVASTQNSSSPATESVAPSSIVSPLDEMNRQTEKDASVKDSPKSKNGKATKATKKAVKVAENREQ